MRQGGAGRVVASSGGVLVGSKTVRSGWIRRLCSHGAHAALQERLWDSVRGFKIGLGPGSVFGESSCSRTHMGV